MKGQWHEAHTPRSTGASARSGASVEVEVADERAEGLAAGLAELVAVQLLDQLALVHIEPELDSRCRTDPGRRC